MFLGALEFTPALEANEKIASTDIEIPYGDNTKTGEYIQVNGIRLYFETYGDGAPMLQIHGNGDTIWAMRYQIEYFSTRYRVVVPDWRGSGKTEIGTGALTYDQIADDLNALLEHMGLQSCYVLGWSDGGVIGLLLAMKHPDKVGQLAIAGARLRPDGLHDWAPDCIKKEIAQYDLMISQGDQSKPWRTMKQRLGLIIEGPNIPASRLGWTFKAFHAACSGRLLNYLVDFPWQNLLNLNIVL